MQFEDPERSHSLSMAVIDAIADHKGVDPLDLDPIYDVIDLDALDQLVSWSANGEGAPIGQIVFTYEGSEVCVTGDGDVRISAPAAGHSE